MLTRRKFIFSTALSTAALLSAPRLLAANGLDRLLILHTNDLHCHLEPFPENDAKYPGKGGLNRISAYVKQMRKQNPDLLLFDCGDFSQGTPYYNFYKADIILKLMSSMGYNAGTIGNHEFDSGLTSLKTSLQQANFPIISSNYDFSRTTLAGSIKENLVIEKKGLRIGIYALGIELLGLVGKSLSEETIYLNPLETALKQEQYLKEEMKCDMVICLSHLGFEFDTPKICDKIIARETNFTDLILGGHTHTFLDSPVEEINKRGNPVVVNQAGWASLMLGQIEFYFENDKRSVIDFTKNKPIE